MTNLIQPGCKASFLNLREETLTGVVKSIDDGKVLISVRRVRFSGSGGLYKIPLDKVTFVPEIDPRNHSEKGLETLTKMATVAADWGLADIKWELRKVNESVWVLCPLCGGDGRIGTVDGKTVNGCEAWNRQASKTIRTCTQCPQVRFTRKGREWFRLNEETGVWEGTGGNHHGAAHSVQYAFMNGLIEEIKPIMKEVGVVQWAKGTRFDSRFAYRHSATTHASQCELCAKPIPSGWFVPVTGKGADGAIHGMWVGMDCARKFFGVKNFKENQVIERSEGA